MAKGTAGLKGRDFCTTRQGPPSLSKCPGGIWRYLAANQQRLGATVSATTVVWLLSCLTSSLTIPVAVTACLCLSGVLLFRNETRVCAVSPNHIAAVQAGYSSEQDKECSGVLQRCGRDSALAHHLGYERELVALQ